MPKKSEPYRTVKWGGLMVTEQAAKILKTVTALKDLGLPAAYVFEAEDTTEHFKTCESLLDHCTQISGVFIWMPFKNEAIMVEESNLGESGKYIFILD